MLSVRDESAGSGINIYVGIEQSQSFNLIIPCPVAPESIVAQRATFIAGKRFARSFQRRVRGELSVFVKA